MNCAANITPKDAPIDAATESLITAALVRVKTDYLAIVVITSFILLFF